MKITGLNSVAFAVADVESARRFCKAYGLTETEAGAHGARFEAQDGTNLIIRSIGDASLPTANIPGSTARQTCWGVADTATLEAIGAELTKDRAVRQDGSGLLHSLDDDNQAIAFAVDCRRPYNSAVLPRNIAGLASEGRVNQRVPFDGNPMAHSLGHIVYGRKIPREVYGSISSGWDSE